MGLSVPSNPNEPYSSHSTHRDTHLRPYRVVHRASPWMTAPCSELELDILLDSHCKAWRDSTSHAFCEDSVSLQVMRRKWSWSSSLKLQRNTSCFLVSISSSALVRMSRETSAGGLFQLTDKNGGGATTEWTRRNSVHGNHNNADLEMLANISQLG